MGVSILWWRFCSMSRVKGVLMAAVLASAVVVLSLVGMAEAVNPDLCYQISWDLANPNGPKRQLLQPVTAYPAQHAIVSTVCYVERDPTCR